jgi:NAD(P)-dependent dehydrogenase (short-subunit alcohol dehydrogenase family)
VYVSESPIAILTGGGSGIGREVALQLAGSGWRIAIVGRRGSLLDDTLALIRAQHPKADALAIVADIADPPGASTIVASTVQKWGPRIDGLINNAAVLIREPIDKTSEESIRQSFEVNVLAPMRLVREVWPIMAAHGGGRVVNVSSLSSLDPFPGLGAYGMTKSALEGLTRAINNEGRAARIRAFNVLPGAVETEMLRSVVSENQLPKGQAVSPEVVARVIVECVLGLRDSDAGKPLIVQAMVKRRWWKRWRPDKRFSL